MYDRKHHAIMLDALHVSRLVAYLDAEYARYYAKTDETKMNADIGYEHAVQHCKSILHELRKIRIKRRNNHGY